MRGLSTWLLSIAGPMVKKVLTQLGIGIVGYAAVVTAVNAAIASARANWESVPAAIMQMLAIGGVNHFLGIVFGAIVARLSLMALKRFRIK